MIKIGIDLAPIERFSFIHTPGGRSFYKRIYTPEEQNIYGDSLCELAACFAGKEAVSKVLGTGLSLNDLSQVSCTDIEILPNQPEVRLSNQAQRVAEQLGLANLVLRYFFLSSNAIAIAGGVSQDIPCEEMLHCIEDARVNITSQLSSLKG